MKSYIEIEIKRNKIPKKCKTTKKESNRGPIVAISDRCASKPTGHSVARLQLSTYISCTMYSDCSVNKTILKPRIALAARREYIYSTVRPCLDICRHGTFHPNPCMHFWVILLTDRQTRAKTGTSLFVGGNNLWYRNSIAAIISDKGGGKCVCPRSFVCLSVC